MSTYKQKITATNSGFIDPLSIIGILLLIITLGVGTAVTTNKEFSLNISEYAREIVDKGDYTAPSNKSVEDKKEREDKGEMDNEIAVTTVESVPQAPAVTADTTSTSGFDFETAKNNNATIENTAGYDKGNGEISGYYKVGTRYYAIGGTGNDPSKYNESPTSNTTTNEISQDDVNKSICQVEGGYWENGNCSFKEQAEAFTKVTETIKQQETVRQQNEANEVRDESNRAENRPVETSAPQTVDQALNNVQVGVTYSVAQELENIDSTVQNNFWDIFSNKYNKAVDDTNLSGIGTNGIGNNTTSVIAPSVSELNVTGPTLIDAIKNPGNYAVANGNSTANSVLSGIDYLFVNDTYKNYWQGQIANAKSEDSLTDIAFNLQTVYDTAQVVTFNKFDDYVNAYHPDNVKISWQAAGYESARACQKDLASKYGPEAAKSCNTYSATKEQISASVDLGVTLTTEAYVLAVAPQLISSAATTGGVGSAVATALGQAQVVSSVYQLGDTVSYCALNGSNEECEQKGARTAITLATMGASQLANSSAGLAATYQQATKILNTVANAGNIAIDTGDVVTAYSDPDTDSLTRAMAVAAVFGDIGGIVGDFKQGQLGFSAPKVDLPTDVNVPKDIPIVETKAPEIIKPVEPIRIADAPADVPIGATPVKPTIIDRITNFVIGDIASTPVFKPTGASIPDGTKITIRADTPIVEINGVTHPLEVGKEFPGIDGSKVAVDPTGNYHLVNADGSIATLVDNRGTVDKVVDWVNNLSPASKNDKIAYDNAFAKLKDVPNPTKADISEALLAEGYNPNRIDETILNQFEQSIPKYISDTTATKLSEKPELDRLIKYIVGPEIKNVPELAQKMKIDQQAIINEHSLPSYKTRFSEPEEYLKELLRIAEANGITINVDPKTNFVYHDQGIITLRTIESYSDTDLKKLVHELTHALDYRSGVKYSPEQLEYRAYIVDLGDAVAVQKSLGDNFVDYVFGGTGVRYSLEKYYKDEGISNYPWNIKDNPTATNNTNAPTIEINGVTHPLVAGEEFPDIPDSRVAVDPAGNYHLINPDGSISTLVDNKSTIDKVADWFNKFLPESKNDQDAFDKVVNYEKFNPNDPKSSIVGLLIKDGYNPNKITNSVVDQLINAKVTENRRYLLNDKLIAFHLNPEYKALPKNITVPEVYKNAEILDFQKEVADLAKNPDLNFNMLEQAFKEIGKRESVQVIYVDTLDDVATRYNSSDIAGTKSKVMAFSTKIDGIETTIIAKPSAYQQEYGLSEKEAIIYTAATSAHEVGHSVNSRDFANYGIQNNTSESMWATELLQQQASLEILKSLPEADRSPMYTSFIKSYEDFVNEAKQRTIIDYSSNIYNR